MAKNEKVCFTDEEGEVWICCGYETKESALRAIHKIERKDCGYDKDELLSEDMLKEVQMRVYKKEGDWYWDWSGKQECKDCGRDYPNAVKGFISQI